MIFDCIKKTGNRMEKWTGRIKRLKNYGSHFEMQIESRSGITVLFGKTSSGGFCCMPDFGAGCHIVDLKDKFWNTEKLMGVMGKIDGITVATALYAVADKVEELNKSTKLQGVKEYEEDCCTKQ